MRLQLVLCLGLLELGGCLITSINAKDAQQQGSEVSKPLEFGVTRAKSNEPDSKGGNLHDLLPKAKPLETKVETKPPRIVQDRQPGTITVKPLAVNFGSLTFGMTRKSGFMNGYPIDPYQSSFGVFSNRADTIGTSYDLEGGVMVTSNIEAFAIIGVDFQRPFSKVVVSNNNFGVPFGQFDEFAYDFQQRRNYSISLGARYYWNTLKPWFPFVGIMGTAIFQDAVRANVFTLALNLTRDAIPIGSLVLQERKRLWGGTFQVGADYQFTDLIALTLLAGLQYTPRTHMNYSVIAAKQITYRDNRSMWSLPIMAALKFTF